MKIQILSLDDLEALYVDGKLAASAHSLTAYDVAKAIVGEENVTSIEEWNFDKGFELTDDGIFMNDIQVTDDQGNFSEEWPFDEDIQD